MSNLVKVCALCDQTILAKEIVCAKHREDAKRYRNEPWFRMLVESEDLFFETSEIERFSVDDFSEQKMYDVQVRVKPQFVGRIGEKTRKRITPIQKMQVADYMARGWGRLKIAKALEISPNTIKDVMTRIKKEMSAACAR